MDVDGNSQQPAAQFAEHTAVAPQAEWSSTMNRGAEKLQRAALDDQRRRGGLCQRGRAAEPQHAIDFRGLRPPVGPAARCAATHGVT